MWQISYDAGKRVADGGTDRAATMAYYAVQSLFPGLFVLVVVALQLTSAADVERAVNQAILTRDLDPQVGSVLKDAVISAIQRADGTARLAGIVAAVFAVSSASSWLAATGRAIEPDAERRTPHNLITGRLRAAAWTGVLILLVLCALVLVTAASEIAAALGDWAGVGSELIAVATGLATLAATAGAMLLVYRIAPDLAEPPPLRTALPGAIIAAVGWVLGTGLFSLYVRHLASIGTTYGAFATPVILLIWLWLTGVIVLYGAAINALLAERRGEWRVAGAARPTEAR